MTVSPTSEHGFGLLSDPRGRIQRFLRDDLRLSRETRPGSLFHELLDDGSHQKAEQFLKAIRERGAAFNWVLDVRLRDGTQRVHFAGGSAGGIFLICGVLSEERVSKYFKELLRMTSEQTGQRHVRATVASGTDPVDYYEEISRLNSELVNAQRELHKKNQQLERLNAEKNRAIGMLAHDLRNPISLVAMQSAFLLESDSDEWSEQRTNLLTSIRSTCDTMLSVVNDSLDLVSIEQGRLKLNLRSVEFHSFVAGVLDRSNTLAAAHDVAVHHESRGLPTVVATLDPGKIEQVVHNLVDNAVKFTEPGGTVEARSSHDSDYVHLSVQDRGQGIAKDEVDQLFQPFHCGNSRASGTGLGLAIVKKIVSEHGGMIHVETELGEGSTFSVRLPIRPVAQDSARSG